MTAELTLTDIFNAITDFAVHVEGRFEVIDHRFDQLELRMDRLESQMRATSYELRQLNKRVDDIDGRLMAVENDVKDIFFCLPAAGGAER